MTIHDAVGTMAREIATRESPPWGLIIPCLVLAAVAFIVGWRRREGMVQRELGRFAAATGLPDPGPDRAWVTERVRARVSGRLLGAVVAFTAAFLLMVVSPFLATSESAWWIALVPFGQVVGTALGHLRPLRARVAGPRVATLRARTLGDYVTTPEVLVALACLPMPVVTLVLAVLNLVGSTTAPAPAVVAIVAAALGLLLAAVLALFVRRALAQPVGTEGPAGLGWAELLRAQMLRDLVGGVAFAGAFSGGFILFWGVASAWLAYPDWYLPVAMGIAAVACGAMVVSILVAVRDKGLGWARTHALSEFGRASA